MGDCQGADVVATVCAEGLTSTAGAQRKIDVNTCCNTV